MLTITFFALALLPGVMLATFILSRDIYKPEPQEELIRFLKIGFWLSLPVLFVKNYLGSLISPESIGQHLLSTTPPTPWLSQLAGYLFTSLVIATFFEWCKFVAVRERLTPIINEVSDGIFYSIMAALGFGIMNWLHFLLSNPNLPLQALFFRALVTLPIEVVASGIAGYYFGLAWFGGKNGQDSPNYLIALGLGQAILLHTLGELFLNSIALAPLTLPLITFFGGILLHLLDRALAIDCVRFGHGFKKLESHHLLADADSLVKNPLIRIFSPPVTATERVLFPPFHQAIPGRRGYWLFPLMWATFTGILLFMLNALVQQSIVTTAPNPFLASALFLAGILLPGIHGLEQITTYRAMPLSTLGPIYIRFFSIFTALYLFAGAWILNTSGPFLKSSFVLMGIGLLGIALHWDNEIYFQARQTGMLPAQKTVNY